MSVYNIKLSSYGYHKSTIQTEILQIILFIFIHLNNFPFFNSIRLSTFDSKFFITMKPTIIPTILSAIAGLSTAASGVAQSKQNQPNIVFILADDMGYGDLACYGNKVIATPVIDKLAQDGMRFTQCYAGSAVSSPSRCALMTGKHTGHTTIRNNFCKNGGLPGLKNGNPIRRMHILPSDTTIATILNAAGYKTCLVNKWHLDGFNPGAGPLDRGFNEFYGWLISTEDSNTPYYYPALRFSNRDLTVVPENENNVRGIHDSDLSVDESIDFIRRNKNQPFFLYLAFDVPHEPYHINSVKPYDSMGLTETAQLYASLITHTDEAIGRLIDFLEKEGLRDNTLIIFASDNGGAQQAPLEELNCNGGLRGRKALMYEGGIRVPFIANWKGHIPAGETRDNPIYFPDVMPTLAALANAKLPAHTDGLNILPLLSGKSQNTSDRVLYWEFPGEQYAIRKGDWKMVLIRNKTGETCELFNIAKDPFEKNDLSVVNPQKLEEMKSLLKSTREPSPYWPTKED